MERSAGILLPVFSLPSPYGIGTLGKAAFDFVDFLHEAGQTYWQVLPAGPVTVGESPYQTLSAYAGNPYFIDLDLLCEDGLLSEEDLREYAKGVPACSSQIDYVYLEEKRIPLLRKAAAAMDEEQRRKVMAFREENRSWLPDYALYMAIREKNGNAPWTEWPKELQMRDAGALHAAEEELGEEIFAQCAIQYLFECQWKDLRDYAHEKGIRIIGDLPIYVALDSADVWMDPKSFQLGDDLVPSAVAGCPPDSFSEEGQHWGNPLYDWDAMRRDGFGWWIRRIDGEAKRYDVLRIDHFRGLEGYWSIPAGKTPKEGHWEKGPGMDLLGVLVSWFPQISFIAEDLGMITQEVHNLRLAAGIPGMKVLVFAFDANAASSYLPHRVEEETVLYTGTHDNAPLGVWIEEEKEENIAFAVEYTGARSVQNLPDAVIRFGMCSRSSLFIAQLQDYLETKDGSRINMPGTLGNNWKWRLLPGQAGSADAKRIARMTAIYGRWNPACPYPVF